MVGTQTMIQPMAKQKGITERGNMYVLSQSAPNKIHLTIQNGDYVINDTLEDLRSEEEMIERRNTLEDELIAWIHPQPETPQNETAEQVLLPTGSDASGWGGLDATDTESL
jgi:hypothetical protein